MIVFFIIVFILRYIRFYSFDYWRLKDEGSFDFNYWIYDEILKKFYEKFLSIFQT